MTPDQFWEINNRVRAAAGSDLERRVEELRAELLKLPPKELQSFREHYDNAIRSSDRWDLIGAAYLMARGGGVTDDGFRYFQDWLISEGEDAFLSALADADSLANVDFEGVRAPQLEAYHYVASGVYKEKTGEPMPRESSLELLFVTPAGNEWEYEELPSILPRLARKYAP